jgi:release factor glutamine methyltransferase
LSSIQDLYLKGKALLEKATNPPLEAKIILLKCLGLSEESFYTHPNRSVSEAQSLEYLRMVSKRAEGMPLAYVIEEKEFWSIPFRVCPGVLIPRPETELLVEKVLELSSRRKELIVDLGTGAGNIAVSLARELPAAEIVGTDVSQEALDVAVENASRQKVPSIRFEKGSLFEPLEKLRLQGKCDMIVSNPPYVSEGEWQSLQDEIRLYEPEEALVAGRSGLEFIRRLVKGAPEFLKPGGYLCLEIGYGQNEQALSLFGDDWDDLRCYEDLSSIPRVITARL